MTATAHRRRRSVLVLLAAMVTVLTATAAACGGDGTDATATTVVSSTTSGDTSNGAAPTAEPSTTAAEDRPEPSPAGDLPGMSAECQALLVELLRIIEPYVEGRETPYLADADIDGEAMGAATSDTEERILSVCPSLDNEAAYEMMVELARQEAPGVVWYLEVIALATAAQGG